VENAVRHGVRMKPDGRGTVKIFVEQKPDCYEITVQDDGPGFDATVPPADGKPHIGIHNVRTRLEDQGGSLTIHSELGTGTAATIRVPKKKGE
jgi:sensor histidine kinase YesM